MSIVWDDDAWSDHLWRQALEHGFRGCWSRRITEEHRPVYRVAEEDVRIAARRYRCGA